MVFKRWHYVDVYMVVQVLNNFWIVMQGNGGIR